jgi:hypothetical protein
LAALFVAVAASPSHAEHWPNRILYFTQSAGYRHEVIPTSQAVLKLLGENSRAFRVTTTEDVSAFTRENLRRYAAVMFFTTGELPMSDAQKAALLGFVRSGRGFLGVHSATDTFYLWPEYRKLVGGYFNQHPWHQKVTIDVADPTSTGRLSATRLRRRRDLSDPGLRSADLAHPAASRSRVGRPRSEQCAPAGLWLAAGLDPLVWPRARVLYGARPRGGGVARPALSADADERRLVDDQEGPLTPA